jgi:hypothetical protein
MIKNTDKFRQASIHFQKYGYYTVSPKGTTGYKEYWDEETRRCLFGWTADDGDFISGYNYFYLNYSPILIVEEREIKIGENLTKKIVERKRDFPKFYDYDYQYFNYIEEAEHLGKHAVVIKARRKGYSYKGSSMLCRNFYLIPQSKSYAIASENEYLTKDGLLTKAWDLMSWIDANTAWTKKRQKVDTKMHKRASYVVNNEGTMIEAGIMSEIIGVTLKNDIQKARGKAAKLILWEEGGKFPGLKDAWQIARPSVEQGSNVFGLMIAYGTGGTNEADYTGLKDLFYEPDGYNVLSVDNIWDEGSIKKCGFFVPDYANMEGYDDQGRSFMDNDGNTNIKIAIEYSLKERQKIIDNATDRNAIDRYIAEHPFNPMEATLQLSGNIFPKKDLIRHLAHIRNNEDIKNFKQVGELYTDEVGLLKWRQSKDLKDLTKYKLDKTTNREGAIVIWEHPMDNPPWGLYIGSCDSYDYDKSGTDSLGSVFIYKRFQTFEYSYDTIVAEYTGRPDTADDFYEIVRKLLVYYHANVLYENQNPGLSVYFKNKHIDYLLADQPGIISKIIKDSKVARVKGTHMVTALKDWAEGRLRDWLIEEYEPGKKNLTKIYSEPLLEELIAYNDKGNFDRVSAMFILMIYIEELHELHVKKKEEIEKVNLLFEFPLFGKMEFESFK